MRNSCSTNTCAAGTYQQPCTSISDKSCVSCPSGQYQDETDQTSCKTCMGTVSADKTSCELICNEGQYAFNSACETCPTGQFMNTTGHVFKPHIHTTECYSCTTCFKGSYVVNNCTTTVDRTCLACPDGQYQDEDNQLSCKTCPYNISEDKRIVD